MDEERVNHRYPDTAGLSPKGAVLVLLDMMETESNIFPEEAAIAADWTETRRIGFAAGRCAAHQALVQAGLTPIPVLRDVDGLPRWPAGYAGCISHKEHLAAAVVMKQGKQRSVGLDVERVHGFPDKVSHRVMTAREQKETENLPPRMKINHIPLVFSAKECFYKAQYPLTRSRLNWTDVEVETGPSIGEFRIVLTQDIEGLGVKGKEYSGRWRVGAGFVITIMAL